MLTSPSHIKKYIGKALQDQSLKEAVYNATHSTASTRQSVIDQIPYWQSLRSQSHSIKKEVMDHLAEYLKIFEENCKQNGIHLHWAEDAKEARNIIMKLAQENDVRCVVKSKSLTSEEIELNPALEKAGMEALKRTLPLFVAMDNDEVVGWIGITFPDIPPLAHSGTLVMGILPEYRRQGIGSRLLERAVSFAFEDENRSRIQLEVIKDNEAAITFYTKHGFSIEGIAERAILLEDEYKDIVHMARLR